MLKKLTVSIIIMMLCAGCALEPSGPADPTPPSVTPAAETPAPTPEPTAVPTATPEAYTPNENATTPILIEGLLIGGVNRGEWMYYDTFYKNEIVDFDGYVYDVYVDDAYAGGAAGELPVSMLTGEALMPEDDLSDLADVFLYDEGRERVVYDLALQGDWELFPRAYTEQGTDSAEYLAMVKSLLTGEGLADPITALKQAVTVDLDGDGTDEVLAAADNTVDGQFEQVKKGDNAALVFRKMVDGQPVDQLVDFNIAEEDPDYVTIYRLLYAVQTCADLDGDGTLEVVVKSWYYEGVTYSIYKLKGDRLELVASNGVGF